MTTVVDSAFFTAINATTGPFSLKGGKYFVASYLQTGTSVVLSRQGPDQNYYPVTAVFAAPGFVNIDLPPGLYKFTLAATTAVTCEVTGVPY